MDLSATRAKNCRSQNPHVNFEHHGSGGGHSIPWTEHVMIVELFAVVKTTDHPFPCPYRQLSAAPIPCPILTMSPLLVSLLLRQAHSDVVGHVRMIPRSLPRGPPEEHAHWFRHSCERSFCSDSVALLTSTGTDQYVLRSCCVQKRAASPPHDSGALVIRQRWLLHSPSRKIRGLDRGFRNRLDVENSIGCNCDRCVVVNPQHSSHQCRARHANLKFI